MCSALFQRTRSCCRRLPTLMKDRTTPCSKPSLWLVSRQRQVTASLLAVAVFEMLAAAQYLPVFLSANPDQEEAQTKTVRRNMSDADVVYPAPSHHSDQ